MLPRWLHHGYATMLGYFWLPCPICDRMFGGHECGDVSVRQNDGSNHIACNHHKAQVVVGDPTFPTIITKVF